MKAIFTLKEKSKIVFLILFASIFIIGCQEDLIDTNEELPTPLKDAPVQIEMTGTLPSGALYEIELPPTWNSLPKKILTVYAHGYVDPYKPISLPNDKIEGKTIKEIVLNDLTYGGLPFPVGYASTSYRDNGLVVLDAIEDIKQFRALIDDFFAQPESVYSPPDAVLLVGVSEGGLITVLTIEQNPGLFDAAIATCCPIGNFYDQLQYYGDAHVLFKYFFGPSFNDINIGSPKGVSKNTMNAWADGSLQLAIAEALQNDYIYNNGDKIRQFIACANIPISEEVQAQQPEFVIQAILEVLRFPIMATNDAIIRLGGNPYNNKYPQKKQYTGSDNDRKLNLTVERVYRKTWEQAVENVKDYETTGIFLTPLLSMHTQYDHVSLFSQQLAYIQKVESYGNPQLFVPIPVLDRYGHCNFTLEEVNQAIGLLLSKLPD